MPEPRATGRNSSSPATNWRPKGRPQTFSGRVQPRPYTRPTMGGDVVTARPQAMQSRPVKLVQPTTSSPVKIVAGIDVVKAQPFAKPAASRLQSSHVLHRQSVHRPTELQMYQPEPRYRSKLQITLVTMACLVFAVGLCVSAQTVLTNHNASAQVAALSKKVDTQASQASTSNSDSAAPSTTKPSAKDIANYAVAPDLARYINIPTLGVHARVLQVGIQKNGDLGVPWDIYDTAWYTGSAKPGQPGATLIDGHVAAWNIHGAFYGVHTLKAGDQLQIVRGDGTKINYQVVKTQAYPANQVDMKAAVTPITPGKSGLNLITCGGQAEKGTNDYNQRIIVFAEQVD